MLHGSVCRWLACWRLCIRMTKMVLQATMIVWLWSHLTGWRMRSSRICCSFSVKRLRGGMLGSASWQATIYHWAV